MSQVTFSVLALDLLLTEHYVSELFNTLNTKDICRLASQNIQKSISMTLQVEFQIFAFVINEKQSKHLIASCISFLSSTKLKCSFITITRVENVVSVLLVGM